MIAYLYLEGCSWYEQLFLTSYQDYINPVQLEEGLAAVLLENIHELAPCHIAIRDFESNEPPLEYGWYNNRFLGEVKL